MFYKLGAPRTERSVEPYGISRGVVEGAARAGSALNPQQADPRELDLRPGVPALSQVTPTAAPSGSGGKIRGQGKFGHETNIHHNNTSTIETI